MGRCRTMNQAVRRIVLYPLDAKMKKAILLPAFSVQTCNTNDDGVAAWRGPAFEYS